jgi:hypothetical protein
MLFPRISRHSSRLLLTLLLPLSITLSGCKPQERVETNFSMGERVTIGSFSYVVVESTWATQLGEGLNVRSPKKRFLMLSLTATNRGNTDLTVPMLVIRGSDGQEYQELNEGAGVTDWLGILRNVGPTKTLQGRVLFDVPLGAYKLRLPDGSESGYDKYAWVDIPLRIDSEQVQVPLPSGEKK